ncbi:MAG: hypothetical protein IJW03_02275 [Clostridia bacterium]|nr:hypothetical protein [Clostridia bacterium]
MTAIERDAYLYEHRFDEAEAVMGKPAADALRKLYDFYGKDWLDWFASLYDTETGAFYYANSSRDNDEFLPDCESTHQALEIMSYFGMLDYCDDNATLAYPKQMSERCVEFIRSLQSDTDGYFYHKQWGSNIPATRRGRDLNSCLTTLKRFNAEPPYPTALERLKDGDSETRSVLPAHLLSWEAMYEYLEKLDINHNSHMMGHTISSQNAQIVAAGLAERVCDYINERQNPETGLWEEEANYSTMSGVVKVGSALYGLGSYVHHGDKLVDSAINVILSDIYPKWIIYVYNPWGGFARAIAGAAVAEREALSRGETPTYSVKSIREKIYSRLPELIDKTIEKLSLFKKPDGSFSYNPDSSQPRTQGVPVSLGENEGDINGLACAMHYTMSGIFTVLGIKRIKMLNYDDCVRFCKKIEDAYK